MALTDSRTGAIDRLLRLAEEGIEKKDRDQACDNGWAALALGLDEVAERRGMKHDHMGDYYLVIEALIEDIEDEDEMEDIDLSFGAAANMHYRWFRCSRPMDWIREDLETVKELLAWLEGGEHPHPNLPPARGKGLRGEGDRGTND